MNLALASSPTLTLYRFLLVINMQHSNEFHHDQRRRKRSYLMGDVTLIYLLSPGVSKGAHYNHYNFSVLVQLNYGKTVRSATWIQWRAKQDSEIDERFFVSLRKNIQSRGWFMYSNMSDRLSGCQIPVGFLGIFFLATKFEFSPGTDDRGCLFSVLVLLFLLLLLLLERNPLPHWVRRNLEPEVEVLKRHRDVHTQRSTILDG